MSSGKSYPKNWIIRCGLILFLLILQGNAAFASADLYEIEMIQVDAFVDESHRIQVFETIDAAFHGEGEVITRTIPLVNQGMRYEFTEFEGEGISITPHWKRDEVILEIRKNTGVFYGKERFHLSYLLQGGADDNRDYDSFYLSVVSPDWNTYIHQVKLHVELPASVPAGMVDLEGALAGLTARETMVYEVDQKQILAESQYFLVPGESVELMVQLPEHTFSEAVSLETFYERTEIWSVGLMLGIILIAFGWWLWSRDKRHEAEIRMDPPPSSTPAEITYLFTKTIETRDLSILLIDWANRGWIHLYPNFSSMGGDEGAVITLERRPPNTIHPFELRFFNLLFDEYGNGHRIRVDEIRGDFSRHLTEIKAHLLSDYSKGEKAFYKTHETKKTMGLTIMASLPIFFFWIRVGLENYRGWIAGILSLILVVIQLLAIRWIEVGATKNKRVLGVIFVLALAGLAVYFNRILGFLMALAAAALIIYLVKRSEKKTLYGMERMRQYTGYREFLLSANNEQLVSLIQRSPEIFFHAFSYAERLGVLQEWKNHFKEIFLLPPIWYHGKESMDFSIEEFTQEIMAFIKRFESAMEAEDRI